MNQRYRHILMWVLYGVLFLAVMLLQTTVFGRVRFYGVKLNLLPVTVVCIAMFVGHEAGGLFALIAAVVWALTGADSAALSIVSLTLTAIFAGWLCDSLFPRRFLPALLLALAAVLLHAAADFLLKYYLSGADWSLLRWVPVTAGLSVLACPVLYPLAKAIGKVGGN